jgi:uncharacterized protein
MKIAAIGDIHVRETSRGQYTELFKEISEKTDILVLCGDLTDLGLPQEAYVLAEELKACTIPVISVLGNHDYQSEQADGVKKILQDANCTVLDQEPFIYQNIGFAGIKGFIGGFDQYALNAFGEPAIKQIVLERDHEAYALENQLKQLLAQQIKQRVVLMHYSPIRETVAQEPADIMPFLGSTRYAQVIDQFGADVVFHGHANMGPHSGKTIGGTPVFNVALPLLISLKPQLQYKEFIL